LAVEVHPARLRDLLHRVVDREQIPLERQRDADRLLSPECLTTVAGKQTETVIIWQIENYGNRHA
jgi:hypothetical protein